jgi:hypothetical protein
MVLLAVNRGKQLEAVCAERRRNTANGRIIRFGRRLDVVAVVHKRGSGKRTSGAAWCMNFVQPQQPEFSETRNCVSSFWRELAVPPLKLVLLSNAAFCRRDQSLSH